MFDGIYRCGVATLGMLAAMALVGCSEDLAPLEVTIVAGPEALTNATGAEFELSCNRECEFTCKLDDGVAEPCGAVAVFEGLADGDHVLAVVAKDDDGEETGPVIWEWSVDTVPPVVEISGPADPTNESVARFDLACSKDECRFECSFNGQAAQPCVSEVAFDVLDDGEHILSVRAEDGLGNVGEESTWQWRLDTVVPEVLGLEGPEPLTNATGAQLWFECSKQDCRFLCELEGAELGIVSPSAECERGVEYLGLEDDTYTFSVIAVDPATNRSEAELWTWSIDTEEPVIAITQAPGAHTYHPFADFEFESTNKPEAAFECALDHIDIDGESHPVDWAPCSSPVAMEELSLGDYEFHIRATDALGNEGLASHRWTLAVFAWATVAAGTESTCGISTDGALWCWGRGESGELGMGADTSARLRPERVGADADWSMVSMGTRFACAVRTDRKLWCWGQNGERQLGVNDLMERLEPVQVDEEAEWRSVSAGQRHACGVRTDGTLWCWGSGEHGRLGLGANLGDRLKPEQVGVEAGWSEVSAGGAATCAVRDDGTLWCWGWNGNGQLGLDQEQDVHRVPARVGGLAQWSTVSAGNGWMCGLRDDDSLWCWGANTYGQLGLGDRVLRVEPTPVAMGAEWIAVSTARTGTCAVQIDGSLWCWGFNGYGQLGLGDTANREAPARAGEGTEWVTVTNGEWHGCGIDGAGSLRCWGANTKGQLGINREGGSRAEPTAIEIERDVRQISAGMSHGCLVATDATLWCWGEQGFGILVDDGESGHRAAPVQVGTDADWSAVASGALHSCALRGDGTLWCWGMGGAYGLLGQGVDEADHGAPVQVAVGSTWSEVSTGNSHTCAVRDDQTLWCWGVGAQGQLGLGQDTSIQHSPVEVAPDTQWRTVSSGGTHTCGVQQNGTLWCWGQSFSGALGVGDSAGRDVPTQVGSSSEWSMVSAGQMHTCGVRTDGTLWCWGHNQRGQLGIGDTSNRSEPQQVGTSTNWSTVATGLGQSCALRTSSTLWCWGYDLEGLDDPQAYITEPERVGMDANWIEVSLGESNGYGLRADGTAWSWGVNYNGQLGNGAAFQLQPVDVLRPEFDEP